MKHGKFNFDSLEVVKAVILVGFLAMCFPVMASDNAVRSLGSDTTRREDVFISYETPASFRGGYVAMEKFLQENVVYPPEAVKDSVQGKVFVQFLIDSLGYVGEVKVARSVREDLDAEAVRVVKMLPRFSPARWFGKTVSSKYILPVTFKLDDVAPATQDAEVKPEFPGGEAALLKYIMDNSQFFPSDAEIRAFKIIVQFYVDEHGKVGDVKILRSVDQSYDSEMIRVIKSLPDFMPGRNVDNEPVGSWYTLPINFKLQASQ